MPKRIRKRGKNSYELSVTNGYDYYGRQRLFTKTVKAANEKEAKKLYYEFEGQIRRGDLVCHKQIKLGDFAYQWYKEYCEPRLAVSTLQNYKRCLQQHIIPALGHIDIRTLQPFQIVMFINQLLEPCQGPNSQSYGTHKQTALYCYRVLSSMLATAIKWNLIAYNPCERVDTPRIQKNMVYTYNHQETRNLVQAVHQLPIREKTLLMVALSTGMRRGELLALQWPDIDFTEKTIHVVRSCQVVPHQGVSTKEPKTMNSMRWITVPDSVLQLLAAYKQWQDTILYADQERETDWVFVTDKGVPIYPSTLSHWFKRFLAQHELPPMPFHGLRHTSATLLLAAGAPIKSVSARLGHADIRTTGNIYAQALQSEDRSIANTMDDILHHT